MTQTFYVEYLDKVCGCDLQMAYVRGQQHGQTARQTFLKSNERENEWCFY